MSQVQVDPSRNDRVERVVETVLPTRDGQFRLFGYRGSSGAEHVALLLGDPAGTAPLVRLHSECMTGDVLGSRRCDCGPQLDEALRRIGVAGAGAVLYLRGHEGRGIGLLEKLRAYRLQDLGFDTVDANTELGHPIDSRDYAEAAAILTDLGLDSVRLLTNNPDKRRGIEQHGVEVVETVPLVIEPTDFSARYLDVKRDRLGHRLPSGGGRPRARSGAVDGD